MLLVADRVDVLPNKHNYICRYTINSYQLSRLYARQKTHTCQVRGTRRGAGCSVKLQIVWPHILPRCSTLPQSKKLSQHVSALKVPFSEMLHDLGLVDGSPRPPSSTGWQGTHGNFLAAFLCRYHIFISFHYLLILEPYNQYPIALSPLILQGLTALKRKDFIDVLRQLRNSHSSHVHQIKISVFFNMKQKQKN